MIQNSIYFGIHFIVMFWNWTHRISEIYLYIFLMSLVINIRSQGGEPGSCTHRIRIRRLSNDNPIYLSYWSLGKQRLKKVKKIYPRSHNWLLIIVELGLELGTLYSQHGILSIVLTLSLITLIIIYVLMHFHFNSFQIHFLKFYSLLG